MSVRVRVAIPGHPDHDLVGDWAWPAVPRQGDWVGWEDEDSFIVKTVQWKIDRRGVEFVYLVLRLVSAEWEGAER